MTNRDRGQEVGRERTVGREVNKVRSSTDPYVKKNPSVCFGSKTPN